MKYYKGFTLIELMTVVSVIAILAAMAIPVYKAYIYRAHAAEVVVIHDSMRTKALAAASVDGNSLCNWVSSQNSPGIDESFNEIETMVQKSLNTLNKDRWTLNNSTSSDSSTSITNRTLVIEYAGVGKQGVDQIKELAKVFQRNGLFHEWTQQLNLLSSFTALLDHCDPVNQILVLGVGVTGTTGTDWESEPTASEPEPEPEPEPTASEPEPEPEPEPTASEPEPELQPLSPSEQRKQCRNNCRVIYLDVRNSKNWKAVKKEARKDLNQCRKECNKIR